MLTQVPQRLSVHVVRPHNVVDGVRCRAKGRGDQKNEGLYFEYRTVDQQQRIDPGKQVDALPARTSQCLMSDCCLAVPH
jgi:hypothetical protein